MTTVAAPGVDDEKAHKPSRIDPLFSWLATVDHKRIGILYLVTAIFFFAIGGVEALDHPAAARAPQQRSGLGGPRSTSYSRCTARR